MFILPALFLFLFLSRVSAQERIQLSFPSFTRADTTRVRALIRQGINLLPRNTDSAIYAFSEALSLSRTTGYDDGIGYALAFMGAAVMDKGEYERGMSLYREAIPYCRKAKYIRNALPSLYINMGGSYFQSGDYARANEYYYAALKYLQQYLPHNDNIATVYNNLATVQLEMGQYRQALIYAAQAEQIARKKNVQILVGSALVNKGTAYNKLNLSDSAMYCYKEALNLGRREGFVDMQQAALTCIGDQLLLDGKNREAIRYYEESMGLSGATSPLHAFIMPGYSMGLALYRLKDYKKAEQVLLSALDKAAKTNLSNDKKEAHATLAAVYEAMGRYKEALVQQRLYEQLKDSQTNTEKLRAINEVEAKYQTAQKDKEIVSKGLQIAQQERRLERKNVLMIAVTGGASLLALVALGIGYSRRKIGMKDRKIEQLKAMMAGEEKERARISRELHDGIGGMLTGIKMNLKTFQKIHEETPAGEGLNDIMDMLQDMGEEIHKTAHNLMPDILLKHNLREALLLYCEQLDTGGKLEIDLQFHGAIDELDKSLELPLYRIIQELLQNIIKHANATLVAIQLRRDDDIVRISVEDNGTGFSQSGSKPGLGLLNIETRIQALNGYFSIEPAQQMGTTAFIELDINNMN
jgi:signal transduction histidine kinase